MKKLSALLFAVFAITCCLISALTIYAEEGGMIFPEDTGYLAAAAGAEDLGDYVDIDALEEYLRAEFLKFNEKIDIWKFDVPYSKAHMLFRFIDDEMVDCFHIEVKTAYGYESGNLKYLYMTYMYSESEYDEKLQIWEETIDEMLDGIIGNDSLTDIQKALLIHDRIIVHCEYDYKNYLDGTLPRKSYSESGVLIDGRAVCQGYAEAYMYLLELVGIDSILCSSDALDHVWNIVYIDNEGYYVDVTWDDPVWDVSGRVFHDYFLCSYEDEIFRKKHNVADYDSSPSNTQYDDFFWEDSQAEFQLVDGDIYYVDEVDDQIKLYDRTSVRSVKAIWKKNSDYRWSGNFTRLTSDATKLYYSQPNAIYCYDTVTKETEKVFVPSYDFGSFFYIFGFKYDRGDLICEIYSSPNFLANTKSLYTLVGNIPDTYLVKYDANGGSGAPSAHSKTEDIDLILSYEIPTRSGYDFMGWSVTSDGNAEYAPGVKYTDNADVTLYAVWQKTVISVTDVYLNSTAAEINIGDTLTLVATVMPENADNKKLIWTSSDEEIASVSENGIVTAKSAGTVKITVRTEDGAKTADCTINVLPEKIDPINISLSSEVVAAGNTVEIELSLSDNPGISELSFEIGYDSSVMTLKSYESRSGWDAVSDFDQNTDSNPVSFAWVNPSDPEYDGEILTLIFEIKEDASEGEYEITLTKKKVISNQDIKDVECVITSGTVSVVDYIIGDSSGDGEIDARDAVLLAQFLAKWKVEIDELAADCTGDGKLDARDAVLLAQYLAKWNVVLGKH